MRQLAGRWWWVVVLPPVGCLMASPLSGAFLIAAVIWILLLIPPAVMIVYFSILLRPDTAIMTRPHTVTFTDDALTIAFPSEETDDEEKAPLRPLEPIQIPYASITSISEMSGHIVINTKEGDRSTLTLLPTDQLPPAALRRLFTL